MTPKASLQIIAGITAGFVVWKLYQTATGAVSSALDDLASLPGRAFDAVASAAESVVNGTSAISDPDGGGFVTTAPGAGRIPNYTNMRNIDPLIAYFIAQGNTATSRAQASQKGWTQDEISLAVLAMAQHFGNI